MVLRVVVYAYGVLMKNSKFLNPYQSLRKKPLAKFRFLNAMISPNMGR